MEGLIGFAFGLFLGIISVSYNIYPKEMETPTTLCSVNGGLEKVKFDIATVKATCNNKAQFLIGEDK